MGLIEWIGAILGGIAINLVASELFAWGPRFSEWLTRWAVRRLPAEMQERLQEEWCGHLDALHPLSRSLAAIGFALAAYRIKVGFDRKVKGALTLRELLAIRPIVVVTLTKKGALKMRDALGSDDSADVIEFGPDDAVIRRNFMAKAKSKSSRIHKWFLDLYGRGLKLKEINCTQIAKTNSGDLMFEGTNGVLLLFRFPLTIGH